MTEYKPFKLTREETNSALWKKLSEHFKERLDVAREENDNMLDDKATARLRGRIMAYKEILELGETK